MNMTEIFINCIWSVLLTVHNSNISYLKRKNEEWLTLPNNKYLQRINMCQSETE